MIQWKDKFYDDFLTAPSKDTFKKFIQNNLGELDNIDFKETWISKDKLSKILLAMANTQGGIIVFGIKEEADGSLTPKGLSAFKDKADIGSDVSKFISPNLDYEVLDFNYDSTAYPEAQDKKFQVILVHNTPDRIPFVSMGESSNIAKDVIYVRRGTKCEKATAEDIEKIISKKIETVFKASSDLSLNEHLAQLKLLYNELPQKIRKLVRKSNSINNLTSCLTLLSQSVLRPFWGNDEYEEIDNPNSPEESYEAFILRMIEKKKLKIEKVLDLI